MNSTFIGNEVRIKVWKDAQPHKKYPKKVN